MPAEGKAPSWRLLDTGASRGSWNLALDEALFRLARDGASPPTVRFYAWSAPAVSVGYFQSWERELDEGACRSREMEVYRRVTGGRAVLHEDEVTYSVVCGESDAFFGEGIEGAYGKIAQALARGLRDLGVEVQLAAPEKRRGRGRGRHPSCFSSSSGYEISHEGGKLVGSAQKREGGALLQHGSILLKGHGTAFEEILRGRRPGVPPALRMGSLSAAMGRRPAYGEVAAKLAEGFRLAWGVDLTPGELSREENSLARRLELSKYRSPSWNGPRRVEGGRGPAADSH